MNYYDTFMNLTISPAQKWRDDMQEAINQRFDNASTYWEDVGEEQEFGSLHFKNINVRITTIVDALTGQRNNDDYRKIIYPDCDHKITVGMRYKFNDNIWIIYSANNIRTDTASAYARRCNNTMNFEDRYGYVHQEPCYIDYKTTETQLTSGENIDVPSGRIEVRCQLNDWTKNVYINDRFIFGGDVYKIRYVSKFDRQSTFDADSDKLLLFYADYDNKSSNDNFELNIADYKKYDYRILCDTSITNKVGTTGKIDSTVTLDGVVVEEDVVFDNYKHSEIIDVLEDGSYQLLDAGECQIVAYMKKAPIYRTLINVKIGDYEEEPVVVPDTPVILVNKQVTYTIKYSQPLTISIETEAPKISYKYRIKENSVTIKNMSQSNEPLYIVYHNDDNTVKGKYKVVLGGIL